MADYSKLTKKELLYTLFARDLMLEERRKENDLQKATINTLIEDHRASQEWYKKQLADTETQNKRVLEKLELIVSANQELEQKLAEKEKENELMAKTLRMTKFIEKEIDQDKISFALEQLEKVKECLYKIQSPIGEKPTLMDDGDVFEVINNQIKQLKEMK